MKRKSTTLTREERDVLVLGGMHLNGKQLSNTEIAQNLGVSVSRVKTIVRQACVRLKAHNRNEAIRFAVQRGEISLDELFSLGELAEQCSSLGPDMLRRIAHLVRQWLEDGHLPENDEQIICPVRRQDTMLTKAERDVLVLVGCGLTNREIADRLYISVSTVRTFLCRACAKLGAGRRADALILAMKRKEISVLDIFTPNELIHVLATLGPESVEQMAQLLDQELGQEHIPTGT